MEKITIMNNDSTILKESLDILEDDIPPTILKLLLRDKTTHKNIMWCTKDYEVYGYSYNEHAQIQIELITGRFSNIIQPRAAKTKYVQEQRKKKELKYLHLHGFATNKIINLMKRGSAEQMFLIRLMELIGLLPPTK